MHYFYNLFISLYAWGIHLAGWFSPKAKLAINGRKNWQKELQSKIDPNERYIWMHCSSLGEFEQGRPVFEKLKKTFPNHQFALSFFSPSGYEIRKSYPLADVVFYLPFDTPQNAKALATIFRPEVWVLVKYDYWFNHLKAMRKNGVKTIVISALFNENHAYFKSMGKWFLKRLKNGIFHFFVQDKSSKSNLENAGITTVTVSGDTRFDRVKKIAKKAKKLDEVSEFKGDSKLIVIGSSWREDEELWLNYFYEKLPEDWKLVIAPHEIKPEKIQSLKKELDKQVVLFSEFGQTDWKEKRVLLVDAIGYLNKIYASADWAYVGGGFNPSGVHNTLEPAVFGLPVVIGPNYHKFREVNELVAAKVVFPIKGKSSFERTAQQLIEDESLRKAVSKSAKKVFNAQPPSTEIIVNQIEKWVKK